VSLTQGSQTGETRKAESWVGVLAGRGTRDTLKPAMGYGERYELLRGVWGRTPENFDFFAYLGPTAANDVFY